VRYLLCFCVALFLAVFFLVPFSWSNHVVGEAALEKLPIWQKCCEEHDCVPEQIKIINKESNGMIPVEIEGVRTSVAKQKFSPVPSPPPWVCYYKPNGEIEDDNIRCILYPQQNRTAKSWQTNLPVTRISK
jgi:hypothetical protein